MASYYYEWYVNRFQSPSLLMVPIKLIIKLICLPLCVIDWDSLVIFRAIYHLHAATFLADAEVTSGCILLADFIHRLCANKCVLPYLKVR